MQHSFGLERLEQGIVLGLEPSGNASKRLSEAPRAQFQPQQSRRTAQVLRIVNPNPLRLAVTASARGPR